MCTSAHLLSSFTQTALSLVLAVAAQGRGHDALCLTLCAPQIYFAHHGVPGLSMDKMINPVMVLKVGVGSRMGRPRQG